MPVCTSAHGSTEGRHCRLRRQRPSRQPAGLPGCLAALGTRVWCRGCEFAGCTVRTCASCRQYPFGRASAGVLQVPERLKENCQFGGFAYPSKPPHSPFLPRRGGRPRAAPSKGFLNRRFKRVFGYFCRAAKVTAGSGGAEPPGLVKKREAEAAPQGRLTPPGSRI